MFRMTLLGAALLWLAACDPMQSVPRFADVDVAADAGAMDVRSRGDLADLVGEAPADVTADAPAPLAARAVATPTPQPEASSNEGFFASLFGVRHDAIAIPDKTPGDVVPFEGLARVCGLPRKPGQEVARSLDYVIYDSKPSASRPRTFYITGFSDGCAREFTASMAMFGDLETYERIRFGPAAGTQPVSDTDMAYDKIKTRVCRATADEPCGAQLDRLARDTIFVSVYERFGSNPRWKNLLLHGGAVMAMDIKKL